MNLDRPQQLHLFDPKPYDINIPTRPLPPKQTFLPEKQTFYEPPSDIVVYAYCEGQVVILAQQPTNIPDVAPRPSFVKHKKGKHPKWEAMKMASFIYEKYEGKGILV